MKNTVSHYIPSPSALTSTALQSFSNNLTMPSSAAGGVRAERDDVRLRHHALRRHPPRACCDVLGVRPGAPSLAGRRPRSALRSHEICRSEVHLQSGRRSGDQFCVYVCDRFVVPHLSVQQQAQVADGKSALDALTKRLIHDRYEYRFITTPDGATALALERQVQDGALEAGKPLLNPA